MGVSAWRGWEGLAVCAGRVEGRGRGGSAVRVERDGREVRGGCGEGSSSLGELSGRRGGEEGDVPASACLFAALEDADHVEGALAGEGIDCDCTGWPGAYDGDALDLAHAFATERL